MGRFNGIRGLRPTYRDGIRGDFPVGGSALLFPTDITLNATTVAAKAVYYGPSATASDWAANTGIDLTASGSGHTVPEETYFSKTSLVGDGNGTGYWQTSNTSMDISTGDYVLEAVVYTGSVVGRHISARNSGIGWMLQKHAANRISFYAYDSLGARASVATQTNNTWVHVVIISDRDENQLMYINGVHVDTDTARDRTMAGGVGLGFHANPDGSQLGDGQIAWLALWEQAGWLDTASQDAWVTARYALL